MLDRCYKPSAAPSLEARGFDNGRAAPDGDLDSRGGIGTCGECFDRYRQDPRRFSALDIHSRFTGDWKAILEP